MTTRARDALARGPTPDRSYAPQPGERCSRCRAAAGSRPCLLCSPQLLSATLVYPMWHTQRERNERRVAQLADKRWLRAAVLNRRFRHDHPAYRGHLPEHGVFSIHEISAAGSYLPGPG